MSCAPLKRQLAVDLEIERHRQLAADVVHGDVVHRQRLVAGDHHDPLDHGLVVERARRSGDADLGAGQGGANGLGGMTLQQLHPVERQAAAHRQHDLHEQLVAHWAHTDALDGHDAADVLGGTGDGFRRTGRRSVGQRVDGAPAEPPAGDAHEDGDNERSGCVCPWVPCGDRAQPDQHRDRRPHVGAEMQCVGFQRLARGVARYAIEQPRAEEIDHDRNDDHAERPERRFDGVAVTAEQPLTPPPRSPRRTARTAARSRRAP